MNALLRIDNHMQAERDGLNATVSRIARMYARRLRAAIRDNVVSKPHAIELLDQLNRYRRRDDPWSLDMFLADYRFVMEVCCKRFVWSVK